MFLFLFLNDDTIIECVCSAFFIKDNFFVYECSDNIQHFIPLSDIYLMRIFPSDLIENTRVIGEKLESIFLTLDK